MILMRGSHSLRQPTTLQNAISLSSAEAGYYAMTKSGAYALGTQAHFEDWGVTIAAQGWASGHAEA